jgi:hypothetical protein
MYVLQCPEWVRLLYRKKEQVTRKSQVCDLKIRTLDDVDENGYLSGVPFLDVTQLKTTGSKAQRLDEEDNVMAMIENEMEKKVYKVEDVQNLLGLGRSKAYEFIENVYYDRKPFRVLKIGRSYRIPCNSFDKWLNGDEERERVRAE